MLREQKFGCDRKAAGDYRAAGDYNVPVERRPAAGRMAASEKSEA